MKIPKMIKKTHSVQTDPRNWGAKINFGLTSAIIPTMDYPVVTLHDEIMLTQSVETHYEKLRIANGELTDPCAKEGKRICWATDKDDANNLLYICCNQNERCRQKKVRIPVCRIN